MIGPPDRRSNGADYPQDFTYYYAIARPQPYRPAALPPDVPFERRRRRTNPLPAYLLAGCVAFATYVEADERLDLSAVSKKAVAAVNQEARALRTARAGLECLAGTGPCPGGLPSPFR